MRESIRDVHLSNQTVKNPICVQQPKIFNDADNKMVNVVLYYLTLEEMIQCLLIKQCFVNLYLY